MNYYNNYRNWNNWIISSERSRNVHNIGTPWYITGDTMGSYFYFSDLKFISKYQLTNGFLSRYAGLFPNLMCILEMDNKQQLLSLSRGVSLSTMGLLYISDWLNRNNFCCFRDR
jgi:hypothetical protein